MKRSRVLSLLLAASAFSGGCGTSQPSASDDRSSTRPTATAASPVAPIGRWETLRTCQGLVQSLKEAELLALAPAVVGDYFPGQTPQQLARKKHVCSGAEPQRHAHFFTRDDRFGSLDQHGRQVDDGSYRILGGHSLRIGNPDTDAEFRYHVDHDNRLELQPVITGPMRSQALAHPLRFSPAGWAVAVAYSGHTWKRVG